MMNNLGLYIHIPFCLSKCNYCDFYSIGTDNPSIKEEYIRKLKEHIGVVGKEIPREQKVDSIYFGGGTPSILSSDLLLSVLDTIFENFNVTEDAEITMEANPATVSGRELQTLFEGGFHRISFGVQSADNRLLKLIGRRHLFEEARESVLDAYNAGFQNISCDLMYALPTQSVENHLDSIEKVCSLPITHVSMYGLKIEKNTPFGRMKQLELPTEEEYCSMYEKGVELLEHFGFMQYEISNFAKDSNFSRHNMRYWKREEYLGFGPGAHSFYKEKRFYTDRSLEKYLHDPTENLFQLEENLEKEDDMEEELLLSLRLTEGISYNRLFELVKGSENYVHSLIQGGFTRNFQDRLSLSPKGMLVSNTIISDLLAMGIK